ncbi:MAG TPA: hypothetical protein VIW70_08025 [Rubrivivax sp.]
MIPLYTAPVAPGGFFDAVWPHPAAELRADDENRDWIGYESVHPLTWVPPPTTDA